eukprot:g3047.t1
MLDDLKAGRISKGELFEQLTRLQKKSLQESSDSSIQASGGSTSHDDDGTPVNVSDFTSGKGKGADQGVMPPNPNSLPSTKENRNMRQRPTSSLRRDKTTDRKGQRASYWQNNSSSSSSKSSSRTRYDPDREHTYRPQITPLPSHYKSQRDYENQEFTSRVSAWKRKKQAEIQARQEQAALEELEGCSFRPSISERSRNRANNRNKSQSVSERLYNATEHHQNLERAKLLAQERREEEFLATCTFQPKTNASSYISGTEKGGRVRARYMEPTLSAKKKTSRSSGSKDMMKPTGTEECTFRPRTNSIQPGMDSAQAYLQSAVFERLSTPKPQDISPPRPPPKSSQDDSEKRNYSASANSDEENNVVDASSFMANLNQSDESNNNTSQRGGKSSHMEKKKRVDNFLRRQEERDKERRARIAEARKRQNRGFNPKINAKSADMLRAKGTQSFLKRVEQNARKSKAAREKMKARTEKSYSFAPTINKRSRQRRGRTIDELSAGDALRRETSQRLMKMKADQDAMAGLTFVPKTNSKSSLAPKVEGKLRILSDPDTYLERVKSEGAAFNESVRRAALENEYNELRDCTFTPQVHDAPAYVKRIARSMSLSRAAHAAAAAANGEVNKERPGWR